MLAPAPPHPIHAPHRPRAAAPAPRAPLPAPAPAAEAAAAHAFARVAVHPAPARLQAKLEVGSPADPHEREAEEIADRVMRGAPGPGPVAHGGDAPTLRRCSCGGTCPACRARKEKERLARAAEGGAGAVSTGVAAPPVVHEVLRAPGRPLDAGAAAFLEPRFGHSFGAVRVHADARAAESAKAVGARAYTVGRHVVFGPGQYRPESDDGRRLLAHELAHVLQQDSGAVLRRDPGPAGGTVPAQAPAAPPPAPRPAIKGPHLELRSKDAPCACLVFIHNNERNARRVAELLQKHCAYNLAIIEPDNKKRKVEVAGKKDLDPNAFFPPEVVRECQADPDKCDSTVDKHAAAPTRDSTNRQFFMQVRACSNNFALPVVGIHTNVITDTQALLDTKDKIEEKDTATGKMKKVDPFADLPRDIDTPATDPLKSVERMKEVLKRNFKINLLTETEGKTNIFRWCSVPDITRCHIGDPHHPDNLVWVTNPDDFEKVKKNQPDANVALQRKAGPESLTDLSTMFLTLEKLAREPHERRAGFLWLLQKGLEGLESLAAGADGAEGLEAVLEALAQGAAAASKGALDDANAAAAKIHFATIETPDTAPGVKTRAQRQKHLVEQYEKWTRSLAALGLHCCGTGQAATDADAAIRAALDPPPPPKEEKAKPEPK